MAVRKTSVRRSRSSPTIVLNRTSIPKAVEFAGEIKRVGVLPKRREKFRTDGDDFRFHLAIVDFRLAIAD